MFVNKLIFVGLGEGTTNIGRLLSAVEPTLILNCILSFSLILLIRVGFKSISIFVSLPATANCLILVIVLLKYIICSFFTKGLFIFCNILLSKLFISINI